MTKCNDGETKSPALTVQEAASKGMLTVKAVENMYENIAEDYLNMMKADDSNDSAIGPTRTALKKLCDLTAHCAPQGNFVDVGCGPGTNLAWLVKESKIKLAYPCLTGIDLSPCNDRTCQEGISRY